MAIKIKRGTQITFEAKDDAEALRTARDRLGPDAVILSSRQVKTGGFLGLFRRTVLQVSARSSRRTAVPRATQKRKNGWRPSRNSSRSSRPWFHPVRGSPAANLRFSTECHSRRPGSFRRRVYSPRSPKVKKEVPIPETAPDGVEFSPKGLALHLKKRLRRLNRRKRSPGKTPERSQRNSPKTRPCPEAP